MCEDDLIVGAEEQGGQLGRGGNGLEEDVVTEG